MIVLANREWRVDQWHKVIIDAENDFEVLVRRPKWGDTVRDEGHLLSGWYGGKTDMTEAQGSRVEDRIRTTVVDWRGVNQPNPEFNEGGTTPQREAPATLPIPFSWDALIQIVEQFPIVFDQLMTLAGNAYQGRLDAKNSVAPSLPATAAEPVTSAT